MTKIARLHKMGLNKNDIRLYSDITMPFFYAIIIAL